MNENIAVRKVSQKHNTLDRYVVSRNGLDIGLLEKFPNTRTEIHPWKAFLGIGEGIRYLGAFYGPRGGRPMALNAVISGGKIKGCGAD